MLVCYRPKGVSKGVESNAFPGNCRRVEHLFEFLPYAIDRSSLVLAVFSVSYKGITPLGHEQAVDELRVRRLFSFGQYLLQIFDRFRPERAATVNAGLGAGVPEPSSIKIHGGEWQMANVRIAEGAVDSKQNHRSHRRFVLGGCEQGMD